MKRKLELLISSGNIEEAKSIFKQMDYNKGREALLMIGYDTESISLYSFVYSLLCEEESADLHYLASEILVNPLNFLIGAYSTALYHIRCAIRLEPNDISFKEFLLLFYNIPDRLISREEAIQTAKEVIKKNPTSKVAFDILS